MAFLFMAVGIPASGKSSFYKTLINERLNDPDRKEIIYVSSDAIRKEFYGNEEDQTDPAAIFKEMEDRTIRILATNTDVFYDATNLSAKRRIHFIRTINDRLRKKGIMDTYFRCFLFATPYEVCLERNSKRERVVPQYVMERMYKSFEPPHKSEGWDDIIIVTPMLKDRINYWHDFLENCNKIDQCNHHHTLTIGKHMEAARDWALEHDYPFDVIVAAALHDVGKVFTKTFTDAKGKSTNEAHYFNHANTSAYDVLVNRYSHDENFWLDIANLIVHHMDFYNSETYLEKLKNRYGEEFFSKLNMVHIADINAK